MPYGIRSGAKMTSKIKYTYTILRYVHDVITGEFINVGVVMHAHKSGFLKTKMRKSGGRIKHLFPDFERHIFLKSLQAAERSIKKATKSLDHGDLLTLDANALSFALASLAKDDSSLQWSPISGGIATDLEQAFERIYTRYVSKYDIKSNQRRTDEDVWRPVRQLLEEKKIPISFDEKIVTGRTDEITFKKAWKNGSWHAYEALSFDLSDADGIKDKARRWRGHLEAVHDGTSEDIQLSFIVGSPQEATLKHAYENAIHILENAAFRPQIYRENEVPSLVSKIEDEVRDHLSTLPSKRLQTNSQ